MKWNHSVNKSIGGLPVFGYHTMSRQLHLLHIESYPWELCVKWFNCAPDSSRNILNLPFWNCFPFDSNRISLLGSKKWKSQKNNGHIYQASAAKNMSLKNKCVENLSVERMAMMEKHFNNVQCTRIERKLAGSMSTFIRNAVSSFHLSRVPFSSMRFYRICGVSLCTHVLAYLITHFFINRLSVVFSNAEWPSPCCLKFCQLSLCGLFFFILDFIFNVFQIVAKCLCETFPFSSAQSVNRFDVVGFAHPLPQLSQWGRCKPNQCVYFFLDTPTVRPRRPVVLVCWPRTRRPQ